MNEMAPDGAMWVCGACGKRSRDLYGEHPYDGGWDESCMLNAVLCAYKNERSWEYEPFTTTPATNDTDEENTTVPAPPKSVCGECGIEGVPLHDDWVIGHLICDWCEYEMYGCLVGEPPPEHARPEHGIALVYTTDASGRATEQRIETMITRPFEEPTSVTAPPETHPESDQEVQEGVGSLAQCSGLVAGE